MTQPSAPEAPVETDAEKVARAQVIINLQRTRIAEETDHSIGLESQLITAQAKIEQQQQIITGMVAEITRLKEITGEDLLVGIPADEDEPGLDEPS